MEQLLKFNRYSTKIRFLLLIYLLFSVTAFSGEKSYKYYIDLEKLENDRLTISLKTPKIKTEKLEFYFPKAVPGTYSISDFGRFVSNFKAYDTSGKILKVSKNGKNSYVINNASTLDSICYTVDDTWDMKVRKNEIFQPTGTSFDNGKVFLFNNGPMFGSFLGYDTMMFSIRISIPENMKVSSSLYKDNNKEVNLLAKNYWELIDSPIMIADLEKASFNVGNCKITVSVFNENKESLIDSITAEVERCMLAVNNFLGFLPIDNYEFMFYLLDFTDEYKNVAENPGLFSLLKNFKKIQSGALEHKHSSFYVLLNLGEKVVSPVFKEFDYRGFLREVVIHEFMHTINPIGLHSEFIGNFDFYNPKMSKHLWMYEGITEYFASLIMLQNGLINMQEYFNHVLKNKVISSEKYPFNKMSMVEMSENVCEKKYSKEYQFVYTYGALLGLMLDLEIIKLSEGDMTLKDVMIELYNKYGYDNSFDEESFIDEFLGMVPQGIESFFNDFIIDSKKPIYNDYLKNIEVSYYKKDSVEIPGIFNIDNGIVNYKINRWKMMINGDVEITMVSDSSLLQVGDILNIYEIEEKLFDGMKPLAGQGDTVTLTVERKTGSVSIPMKVDYIDSMQKYFFLINEDIDREKPTLRDVWLGKESGVITTEM